MTATLGVARAGMLTLTTLTVVALAGCGSSSSATTTPAGASTTSSAGAVSSSSANALSTSTGPSALPAACSLLTTAQVAELLGGPPAQPEGRESDDQPTYKICDWLSTPPAGGNTNSLDIRVFVRAHQGDPGFGGTIADDGPSSPVTGVGDRAVFASKDGIGANLIVDKGLTSISISTRGSVAGATIKSAMIADVQQVLAHIAA
ncbi:MAG TPA: DUF3558 family protein [Candidatus Dormibacteraeota bacterium]|nr:DUF3558 family protein [Candidatus Dormibacteraeota bacterium]